MTKLYSISLLIFAGLFWFSADFSSPSPAASDALATTDSVPDAVLTQAQTHFQSYCTGCHGQQMQAFVDRKWKHGQSQDSLQLSITNGYADAGMPSFKETFTEAEIEGLAQYIRTGIENVERYAFQEQTLATDTFQTEALRFDLDTLTSDIGSPWGLAFLPDGELLITEKSGTLYRLTADRELQSISGVPDVLDQGQGGLLDVLLHPDFKNNQVIYLSYSAFKREGDDTVSTTAITRATLDGNSLTDAERIFEALPYSTKRHHYGSRMAFDPEGYLYFSVGDRGNRDENPQSLDNHCGKIHRLNADGSVPDDNPFVNQDGAMPSIYSYGHRNPQGLAIHPTTGKVWTHEHGPRGGDEVNIIRKGDNYGWPVISYGLNYDGTTFTQRTAKEGMEQPLHYWVPSIAPCGAAFVTGDRYPDWTGDFLVGSLRYEYLNRCQIANDEITGEELLMENLGRLRSVAMGPDGYIYVGVEDPGAVYRLMPIDGLASADER
ncbi:MAG: PQQ-dependent sugar dehydrogenase [Tunicatimonas sp.]